MTRTFFRAATCVAALVGGGAFADVGGDTATDNPYEVGTITPGSVITINAELNPNVVSGGVTTVDLDFFRFTLAETTKVTVLSISSPTLNSAVDPRAWLYDYRNYRLMAESDDHTDAPSTGNVRDFALRSSTPSDNGIYEGVTLAPGTYFIRVEPYYKNNTHLGPYTLRIVTGDYEWSAGSAAVNMGSSANKMCYLTGVTGSFRNYDSQVKVTNDANGNWILGPGPYPEVSLKGWARCQNVSGDGGTNSGSRAPYDNKYWHQNYGAQSMLVGGMVVKTDPRQLVFNPASSNCWLQGMAGKFDGGLESVNVFPGDPNSLGQAYYYLGGSSNNNSGVSGWSSCATLRRNGTPTPFSLSQGGVGAKVYKTLLPMNVGTKSYTCYLARITGAFWGGGEQVRILNNGLDNTLHIRSNRGGGVAANAICTDQF